MTSYMRLPNFSRRRAAVGVAALGLVLSACSSVTDSLLTADIPDIIPPELTDNNEGALGLSNGALGTFRSITAVDTAQWQQELKLHDELLTKLAYHLPAPLLARYGALQQSLAA